MFIPQTGETVDQLSETPDCQRYTDISMYTVNNNKINHFMRLGAIYYNIITITTKD